MLLHALSHCAKAADRIKKNNDRLRAAGADGAPPLDAVPKDQGFTRAKVGLRGWGAGGPPGRGQGRQGSGPLSRGAVTDPPGWAGDVCRSAEYKWQVTWW